jgi:hypothetical protein
MYSVLPLYITKLGSLETPVQAPGTAPGIRASVIYVSYMQPAKSGMHTGAGSARLGFGAYI